MTLKRVHDLTGDWFAITPMGCARSEVEAGDGIWPVPDVGHVIANTRTRQHPVALTPHTTWADPPFLRVVEVRPLTEWGDEKFGKAKHGTELHRSGQVSFTTHRSTGYTQDETIDLPGAVPGGWAVRVEALPHGEGTHPILSYMRDEPPPSGRPLNEVAA